MIRSRQFFYSMRVCIIFHITCHTRPANCDILQHASRPLQFQQLSHRVALSRLSSPPPPLSSRLSLSPNFLAVATHGVCSSSQREVQSKIALPLDSLFPSLSFFLSPSLFLSFSLSFSHTLFLSLLAAAALGKPPNVARNMPKASFCLRLPLIFPLPRHPTRPLHINYGICILPCELLRLRFLAAPLRQLYAAINEIKITN